MGCEYIEDNIGVSLEYLILRGDPWFESDFVNEDKVVKGGWFDNEIGEVYKWVDGYILETGW